MTAKTFNKKQLKDDSRNGQLAKAIEEAISVSLISNEGVVYERGQGSD
jgi:hypothetical protein